MEDLKNYIEENKDRFLEELFDLIRIPSISSIEANKPDMYKAAEYWKETLLKAGVDKAQVYDTEGHPVTYAEKIIDPKLPTILVYAHMDVMPVDPIELWHTDPFEPVIKDGKIWARGADDDKGQGFMHAKAFEYMVKTDQLPCNFKFMIEGEEEIGSPSLPKWCKDNIEMLKADVIVVSDTGMIDPKTPTITTGLRGLSYWEVEVTGPNRDLHSGLFGGAVVNPINVLSNLIAELTDKDGKLTIPGFYDDVIDLPQAERDLLAKAPHSDDEYRKAIDVDELGGEKGYSTTERTGIRPSFDICGIWGGYTGEGAKTVLPSKAYAKISTRLVPNQNNHKIGELFKKHFENIAPKSVKVNVKYLHGGQAYGCSVDLPEYKAAEKALMEVYGKQAIPVRSGGSIPIISEFEEIFGIKSILMGFGLESNAIHSPNENMPLEQFFNGINALPYFYKYYAESFK